MSDMNLPPRPGKIATGIAGFDQVTGGIVANRATLLVGAPDTGKTIFALQTLVSGAMSGEAGIYVGFAPKPEELAKAAKSFGWELAVLEQKGLLYCCPPVTVADGVDIEESLEETLENLSALCRQVKARRIIFDSFDVLLRALGDDDLEMRQAFMLRDWLFRNELPLLLTARLSAGEPRSARRYALMQIVADCSVALGSRLAAGALTRYLRVLKYRGSTFIEHELPFVIGASGIEILIPASEAKPRKPPVQLPPEIEFARREMEARIQPLDRFLEMKQAELDFLLEKATDLAVQTEVNNNQEPKRPNLQS